MAARGPPAAQLACRLLNTNQPTHYIHQLEDQLDRHVMDMMAFGVDGVSTIWTPPTATRARATSYVEITVVRPAAGRKPRRVTAGVSSCPDTAKPIE